MPTKRLSKNDRPFSYLDEHFEKFMKNVDTLYDNFENGETAKKTLNGIAEFWRGVSEKIKKVMEGEEDISSKTFLEWKKALNEKKNDLALNRNAIVRAGNELTLKLYDGMNSLLDAMTTRVTAYQKAEGNIAGVENQKQENLEQYEADKKVEEARKEEEIREKERQEAERKVQEVKEASILDALVKKSREDDWKATKESWAAAKENLAVKDKNGNNQYIDAKSFAGTMKTYHTNLVKTNESWFTKQSDQFEAFCNCVSFLNRTLKDSKGMITDTNVDQVSKALIAIRFAEGKYIEHCRKHPQTDSVRASRVRLVGETINKIAEFEKANPAIREAERSLIESAMPKAETMSAEEYGAAENKLEKNYKQIAATGAAKDTMDIVHNLY